MKKSKKKKLIKKKKLTKKRIIKKKKLTKKRIIKKKKLTKKKITKKKKLVKKRIKKKKLTKKRIIKKKKLTKKKITKKKKLIKKPVKKPVKKKPVKKKPTKKPTAKIRTIKGIRYEKISDYIKRFRIELQELYPESEIRQFNYIGNYVNVDTMEFVDKVSDFNVDKYNRVFVFYYYKYEYNSYIDEAKNKNYIKGSMKGIGSKILLNKQDFFNNLDNYIQDIKKDVEVKYKGENSDFSITFLGVYGIYFMIV